MPRRDDIIGMRHKLIKMHEVFRVDKFIAGSDEGLRCLPLPEPVHNEGGVWALQTTRGGANKIGAAIVQNAYIMEQRCKAIEKLGGTFYADPKNCPYLDLP